LYPVDDLTPLKPPLHGLICFTPRLDLGDGETQVELAVPCKLVGPFATVAPLTCVFVTRER
jgi:hypothetical protein